MTPFDAGRRVRRQGGDARDESEHERRRSVRQSVTRTGLFVVFIAGTQLASGDASLAGAALLVMLGAACGVVLLGGPALVDRLGDRPDRDDVSARVVDLGRVACTSQRVLVYRAARSDSDDISDLVPRVRPVVAARLARDHGLDVDDAADRTAIAQLVGADALMLLDLSPADTGRLGAALDQCADFLGVTT